MSNTNPRLVAVDPNAIESLVDRSSFRVTVRDAPSAGDGGVTVEANDPAALVALVLRRQRQA
ncbi:MAG TPA: hypothetical protein VIV60_23025, partial [Polyangiaceae bacterium]